MPNRCHTVLLAGVMMCAAVSARAEEGSLRVGFADTLAMPLGEIAQGRVKRGLLLDLYLAIGRQLDLRIVPVVLPRHLVEGAELRGEIDLSCNANPAWTREPQRFVWSPPLFELPDVLFGGRGAATLRHPDALPPGERIAVVRNFEYPVLQPRFVDGSLRRVDLPTQQAVLAAVAAGEVPYGVSNVLTLRWFRRDAAAKSIAPWQFELAANRFHCAIAQGSRVNRERVLAALAHLRREGMIEALLARYR